EGNSSQTGLDENSDANLSIKNFYNDNWGIIWNITANGTNGTFLGGNYSHYETYSSEWQTLIGNNTCHTNSSGINSTNPCYIDKIGNMIWVRLPHFSGTQPGVTGAVVTASSSSSSSGGGGSGGVTVGGATTTISESQLNEGYTKQLAVRDKIKFNISNASHILELTGATATTATIKVTSEPQIATLNVEENKKFELNGDNKYDLDVRFNSVFLFGNGTYRANITMKFDSSEVTTQDSGVTGGATSGTESGGEGETGMNEERGGSLWWLWISLIIIALAAVTGYIIWKKERR
ncbi:MAG: hypothetical protein HYS78_02265, partial [Parcubacteria group bacterium]|nr:hypothetical protein [Parcubacteria group bacterium]